MSSSVYLELPLRVRLAALFAVCAIATLDSRVAAQCPYEWKADGSYPGVSSSEVYAISSWDPDGAGPQPELLVVGGDFEIAGSHYANNIAAWDGIRWSPLGSGVEAQSGNAAVSEIVVHEGQLFAAGYFTSAGGVAVQYIARWDGAQWHGVGDGLPGGCNALISHDGDLYASGQYWPWGDGYILRWDGTAWHPAEAGLEYATAFATYQGALVAAAGHNVYQWNGSTWQSIASIGEFSGNIYTIVEFEGDLVVGGEFWSVNGVTARSVARWNGQTWSAMGTGFFEGVQDGPYVSCAIVVDGRLYAGGSLTVPNTQSTIAGVAQWDGVAWVPVGSTYAIYIPTLGTRQGKLVVAGSLIEWGENGFDSQGGTVQEWNAVAGEWNGFRDVEPPQLRQITAFNGDLYAIGNEPSDAGYIKTVVYRFRNGSWDAIGTATGLLNYNRFNRLLVMAGRLYVAGRFSQIGGIPANCVAAWDGQSWSALGEGFGDEYSEISDLAEFNGKLIAGGRFVMAGGEAIRAIAAWDGTDWLPLGGGLGGFNPLWNEERVARMLVRDGALIVAGHFLEAGGTPVTSLARWDGLNWSALGDPLVASGGSSPSIWEIAIYRDHLVVGGYFQNAGGQVVNNVAEWTGAAWLPLGSGVTEPPDPESVSAQASALAVLGDDLYVGGPYMRAGGDVSNCIARWDGSTWSQMGSPPGVQPECTGCLRMVTHLEVQDDKLLVEGYFHKVNGVLSYNSAYWAPAGPGPVILEEPRTTAVCPQQPATLSVSVGSAEPPAYQWRHNLVPVIDNASLSGTNTPVLSITAISSETTGVYDCVVSTDCSIVVSAPASVVIAAFGGGDGNGDGRIDGRDVEAMVHGIISDTTGPSACRLDMNFDGAVSSADVPAFIARLLAQ